MHLSKQPLPRYTGKIPAIPRRCQYYIWVSNGLSSEGVNDDNDRVKAFAGLAIPFLVPVVGCQGFDDGVNTVWECRGMYDAIKNLYSEKGKRRKLFIAGHSLGGALATIAGARLAFEDNVDIAGIYTIGSPRYRNVMRIGERL